MYERLLDHLRASTKLFADETTAPVLDPGRGRTKTGQLWAYARDDRPWGGTDPPAVAYVYAADRKAERPIAHLAGFGGVLQVDGYAGYRALAERHGVKLAFCWSHVRREFIDLATKGASPIAAEVLARIAALYRIEGEIAGHSAEARRLARDRRSRPLLIALERFLRDKLALVSQKSTLAVAIRYATSRWAGLTLYVEDGRVEMDSNTVERSIRPLALTRKNALFAGSDRGGQHWAVIASLVETCKLNGVDPQAYFADVIARIVGGHPPEPSRRTPALVGASQGSGDAKHRWMAGGGLPDHPWAQGRGLSGPAHAICRSPSSCLNTLPIATWARGFAYH